MKRRRYPYRPYEALAAGRQNMSCSEDQADFISFQEMMSARKRICNSFCILRQSLTTKRSKNSRRPGNPMQASSISIYSLLNWLNKGSSRKHKQAKCLACERGAAAVAHRSKL